MTLSLHSSVMTTTTATAPMPLYLTPNDHPRALMFSLPTRRLKDILAQVIPSQELNSVKEIPSGPSTHNKLSRLYVLTLDSGRKLELVTAPSLRVRLLRCEQGLVSSEAGIIEFLHKTTSTPSSSCKALPDTNLDQLRSVLPTIHKHSTNLRDLNHPYTVLSPSTGSPLSTLSIYLSLSEQRNIQAQLATFVRTLASIASPNGLFGPALKLCPPNSVSSTQEHGSTTWTRAFTSLFESILRDGEDMSVLLPYQIIRQHLSRLSPCLNAVTQPRLFILDATEDSNVLIEREDEESYRVSANDANCSVRFTGLRDWSQAIFGDPLMSCDAALYGVEKEDVDGVPTRKALYKCYKAVVAIVTEYYRPQIDSSRRELEGRRKLTEVLGELDGLDLVASSSDEESGKRVRVSAANDEESDAKRIKIEASA